jgi:hypothetical protein
VKKFLLNYWPPYLREELATHKRLVTSLCDEWAECDTYIENLCLKHGLSEEKVYGNSYGVPMMEEKVDMLIEKLKSDLS